VEAAAAEFRLHLGVELKLDMAAKREPPTYLYLLRARCPTCASPKLLAYRSRRESDESITRWVRCAACGRRLILVLE